MSELQLQMKNTSFYTTPAMERFLLLDVENNYEQYIFKSYLDLIFIRWLHKNLQPTL